jgi:hypothetical protein
MLLLVGLAYGKHAYEDVHDQDESEDDEKGGKG